MISSYKVVCFLFYIMRIAFVEAPQDIESEHNTTSSSPSKKSPKKAASTPGHVSQDISTVQQELDFIQTQPATHSETDNASQVTSPSSLHKKSKKKRKSRNTDSETLDGSTAMDDDPSSQQVVFKTPLSKKSKKAKRTTNDSSGIDENQLDDSQSRLASKQHSESDNISTISSPSKKSKKKKKKRDLDESDVMESSAVDTSFATDLDDSTVKSKKKKKKRKHSASDKEWTLALIDNYTYSSTAIGSCSLPLLINENFLFFIATKISGFLSFAEIFWWNELQ